jgi:hypothetical protein
MVVMSTQAASAHPGHGEVGATHYFTSAEHFGVLMVALAGSVIAVWVGNRFGQRAVKV